MRRIICAVVLGVTTTGAAAGDTNPPAGPVAGTMKTVAEVEPRIAVNASNTPGDGTSLYKISQPGSYYLTADIVATSNRTGVRIAADDVTLDLNGFMLDGSATTSFSGGVSCLGSVSRAPRIRNGVIRNWSSSGVVLVGDGGTLEDLLIQDNAQGGAQLSDHSTMCRCTLIGNSGDSVRTFDSCIVEDCVIETSTASAINAGSGTRIRNNTIRLESGATNGIFVGGIWSRVEGNNITGSASGATGISGVPSGLVACNTVSASITTPYSIAGNAKYGPIISADGDMSTIANADHPWANLIY